jgi:hypothetical protein
MLISVFTNFCGLFAFLFLLWRRLKEDYAKEEIFSLGFFAALGMLGGYLLAQRFFSTYWFWSEILGILLGFSLALGKYKIRFYETLEALILGLLAWYGLFWLFLFLADPQVISFLATLLVACLLVLFALFEANYKDFSWYRSGRIGFSGLTTVAFFFLVRSTLATFFPSLLSFAGKSEVFLSGIASFVIFLMVYNLARK